MDYLPYSENVLLVGPAEATFNLDRPLAVGVEQDLDEDGSPIASERFMLAVTFGQAEVGKLGSVEVPRLFAEKMIELYPSQVFVAS